ncbi:type II toxin-antitoxin system RelE family toxin [Geminocystis herdmanii]|uniref:type II toxin-antitoxin system RelE family toxin n=1 Tax=Geminocystis herdmanii TaxID=669359 RepID=UPI0003457039|nr:type II toxin-antitoxin system RelE/ParE family toxin [Geminocystis herdmanii]
MNYDLIISKSVQKQIDKLPNEIVLRIVEKLKVLSTEPRLQGVIKLKGYDNQYRLRVENYRIRYEIDDSNHQIKILQCKHRREVYRDDR